MDVGTDTWVTLEQANSYFATRFGASAWSALDDATKETLLVSAFNWIFFDADFETSRSSTDENLRVAQLEAAWFLHNYQTEYEGRAANIAGGVTSVSATKWSESYGALKKPDRVLSPLKKAGAYDGSGGMFPLGVSE